MNFVLLVLRFNFCCIGASLMSQMAKYLSAMLGREDPLEKRMTTHSNILTREIPWTEEPGRSMGSKRVIHG